MIGKIVLTNILKIIRECGEATSELQFNYQELGLLEIKIDNLILSNNQHLANLVFVL